MDGTLRWTGVSVAKAGVSERADFIRKTYLHLAGAVVAFMALEWFLLQLPITGAMVELMVASRYGWLVVLGAFMAVSWIAETMARSTTSLGAQYCGLGLYVAAEAVIFAPLLYILLHIFGPSIILSAATVTGVIFAGLTLFVFVSRTDFSFMGSVLALLGIGALGLIVCSIIFGFTLGVIFTVAMIVFACGYILYETSNVLLHYRVGQHVAASLALFACVALLFWYILRLFAALKSND
jgi:hypothetical protein